MPLTIAVVVALTSAVTFYEWRVRRLTNEAGLGWMSVQWLTEHRRSTGS